VRQDRRDEPTSPRKPAKRPWVRATFALLAVVGTAVGVRYYLYAMVHESTDDAFVDGHVVPISPRVAGHVAKVQVTDNQWVSKGDLLVELDPRDFEARLSAGEAALAAARAGERSRSIGVDVTRITSSAGVDQATGAVAAAKAAVDTARAAVAAAQSQVTEAQAQLPAAQAALDQAQAEVQAVEARGDRERAHLQRIRQLVPQNAASEESLSDAEAAERVARADLVAARHKVAAKTAAVKQAEAAEAAAESSLHQAETMVAGKEAGLREAEAQLASAKAAPHHVAQSRSQADGATADAARAEAEVRQARLNLSYTKIYAPVSGHVTRKSVEPGMYVQVGQALLALVEPELWVVANFKETQLTSVRPGQPATVYVDTYPGVPFKAHVDSVQRGSGARFSLLPPENGHFSLIPTVHKLFQ